MTEEVSAASGESEAVNPLTKKKKEYEFDENFQMKIGAMCARDSDFLRRTDGLIDPKYFTNIYDRYIVSCVLRHFQKYKKVPGDGATWKQLLRNDVEKKVVREEHYGEIVKRLVDIMRVDVSDKEFVIEEVATFARYQAVSDAICEIAVKHIDSRDFDKIETLMSKALNVGAHAGSDGYDYGSKIEERTTKREERLQGNSAPVGITTGYPNLDKHLLPHKGWGRGELAVLMGPAKIGKSTALMDFGLGAAGSVFRYNVLYVTLEVSKSVISDRADANIAKMTTGELDSNNLSVKREVTKWQERAGKFVIEDWPTGTMRVQDLRRIIERHKAQGRSFDLVIVDYADLMMPERYTDSTIENSKSIWVALRGIAVQENIAILTATQTNRGGATKSVAQMTDVADDFNKIRIADVVISINRTEDELRMNEARLYFAAMRNAPAGFSVRIKQDISRMKFVQSVEGVA